MRTLVVGSEGYLGRHVVHMLRERQHMVTGMDLGLWEGQQLAPETLVMSGGSDAALKLVRQGLWDVVIYLGAVAHDPEGRLGAAAGELHTLDAPVRMAQCCGAEHVPFVFVSSLSVLDKSVVGWGLLSRGPQGYPGLKAWAESNTMTSAWPKVSILRFGTLYGPPRGLDSYREHLLLNSMCLAAAREEEIKVRGGNLVRPVQPVEGAAESVVYVAEGLQTGGVFEMGAVGNYAVTCKTVREFANEVQALCKDLDWPGEVPPIKEEEEVDTRSYGRPFRGPTVDLKQLLYWSLENKDKVLAKRYKEIG